MTVAIQASMSIQASVAKTISTSDPTATPLSLNLNLGGFSAAYNSGSTPSGSDAWSGHVALTAGAATIDLTNLTQSGVSTLINATGMKLRYIIILPDAANVNPIAIGTGASNGYPSIGTETVLNAGDTLARVTSQSIAVDSTHKTLDLAGTGTQGCELLLVFGS